MSTTSGNGKSFKFIDAAGNIFILTPVDSEARQAIDEAKNLVFDDEIFNIEETDNEVNVKVSNVPFGINGDTPLRIDQDNDQGLILGSDALYAVAATATVYDATSGTYSVGDYCIYLGKIYRCTTAINPAEAWNPSHWTEVHLVDMINLAVSDSVQPADLDNLIVTAYSSSSTYAVGDYCIYNKALYRCSTAINPAEAWNVGHWTAIHDIIAEAKRVKVISSNATDDSTSGTVLTTVVHPNTYKEITVADTITDIVIEIDDAVVGVLQQTGFQFTLGANSVLNKLEVHRGDFKLPMVGDVESFTPGQTYQGSIVHGLVTIAEFDPPSLGPNRMMVGGRIYPTVTIGGIEWMAENLDWAPSGVGIKTGWRHYPNNPAMYYNFNQNTYGYNGQKFGLLYQTGSMSIINNLLTDGWRVPSSSDFSNLFTNTGNTGSSALGLNLKSTTGWNTAGTNTTGFNAKRAGSGSTEYSSFSQDGTYFALSSGSAYAYISDYSISSSYSWGNTMFVSLRLCRTAT